MSINDIITLEDNTNYLILNTIDYGETYYYCIKMADDLKTPIKEYIFISEIIEDGEIFINRITNEKLLDRLYNILANNYDQIMDVEQ